MMATAKSLAAAAPNLLPSASFASEIQSMMYAFGDCCEPSLETATVVEEVLHQQMTEILFQASDVASRRGAKMVCLEDLLFLLRRSPLKIQRLVKYLSVKDLSASVTSGTAPVEALLQATPAGSAKRTKRARDFLLPLDANGLLERALNDELHDEVRMERLKRMDHLSRNLSEQRYAEFTRARQVNFLGHKLKQPQKFSDWLQLRAASWMGDRKVDKTALEVFSYLAYETIGQVVELALLVRRDMEGSDIPIKTFNATFPMVYFHANETKKDGDGSESPQVKKRIKLETPAAAVVTTTIGGPSGAADIKLTLRPIGVEHVREAVRRLTQLPRSSGAWYDKVDARHQSSEARMPVIVL